MIRSRLKHLDKQQQDKLTSVLKAYPEMYEGAIGTLCCSPVLRPLSYQPLADCGASLCTVLGIALLVCFYRTRMVSIYSIYCQL